MAAGVVPLARFLPDATLQAIAAENNQAETAFFVPAGDGYRLRWFTPVAEVELCGHATIASGHVLMTGAEIRFSTRAGILKVSRQELARLVGCSREMAGRVLKKLQIDGKLHARGKTVVLYGTR